ncbi:MAG: ribonuclease HII, partial [Endomicrobium sp.]|nr:ribonuclease HII [Endomicrobium sp.]
MGFSSLTGVDEAGRGPLAGPVAAAAVILPKDLILPDLNDSKKLSEKKRETLFEIIKEKASAYAIETVDNKIIDKINILQ